MTPHTNRQGIPVCRFGNVCGAMNPDQFFSTDSQHISCSGQQHLMNFFPSSKASAYIIAGHTDSHASDDYNMHLSYNRTATVEHVALVFLFQMCAATVSACQSRATNLASACPRTVVLKSSACAEEMTKKLVKITLAITAVTAFAACEGRTGADKGIDLGTDTRDLSQLIAGIWVDPNGCDYWIIDYGVEGYLSARLDKYGKPVCSGAASANVATGNFKGGATSIIGDVL